MYIFLQPWYYYLEEGGFSAISTVYSNYTTPYLVLLWLTTLLPFGSVVSIKLISIIFTGVLALGVFMIAKHIKKPLWWALAAGMVALILPNVFLNTAVWGQCDVMFTGMVVFCLYFILKNKPVWACVFFGLALALKLQVVFFAPVMLYFWIRWVYQNKKDWKIWLAPLAGLAAVAVMMIPGTIAGRPIFDMLHIYFGQTGTHNYQLSVNAANFYNLIPPDVGIGILSRLGIVVSLVLVAFVLVKSFLRFKNNRQLTSTEILILPVLVAFILPMTLPFMHERYLFLAEILAFVWLVAYPSKETIFIALGMQAMAYFVYMPYLFNFEPVPRGIMALMNIGLLYLVTKAYFTAPKELKQEAWAKKLSDN